ncbi:MAG: YlbF family regulator [Bacilli bacterium]|jgi:cell fate (sporulation/competence/biofilm development) regulator YmcA (YheA/YmcA/DUF963 family)
MSVNKELDLQISKVKKIIDSNPIVQNYLSLRNQIENDQRLNQLHSEIALHQKTMSKNIDKDAIYFQEKTIYEKLYAEYVQDPLIVNFSRAKEELDILLSEIHNVLQ